MTLRLVGAILELVSVRVEDGRTDALPELAETLTAFVARNAVAPEWPYAQGWRPMGTRLDHVRSYYDALNKGDPDEVAAHFTDDATHYYTRLGPHEGARTIGEHTQMAVKHLRAQWHIEDAIEDGDRAVIEWTMSWTDPRSGDRRLDRGTEWFEFQDDRIAEVRAYHHSNEKNRSGDLLGFDHEGRGHTMLDENAG